MALNYNQKLEDGRFWWVSPRVRYGVANRHINPSLAGGYEYDRLHKGNVGFHLGSEVADFNRQSPVPTLVSTIYTLVAARNVKKIYERRDRKSTRLNSSH